MKKHLFLWFLCIVSLHSCKETTDTSVMDGMLILKPGHFCQLGDFEVLDDTIVVVGSFIEVDNPNIVSKPINSYMAKTNSSGYLFWSLVRFDYVRWQHLQASSSYMAVTGYRDAPLEGYGISTFYHHSRIGIHDFNTVNTGKAVTMADMWYSNDTFSHLIIEVGKGDSVCVSLQKSHNPDSTIQRIYSKCYGGQLHAAKFIDEARNFALVAGSEGTSRIFEVVGHDSHFSYPLDSGIGQVNQFVWEDELVWLVSTSKNAQGPCLWKLDTQYPTHMHTCLDYWPFHGSTQMVQYKDNTILAFNAADSINDSKAMVVMLDVAWNVVWEEEIATDNPFIISRIKVAHDNLYVGGTLEISGKGSAIAIKPIPIPKTTLKNPI